MSLQGPGIPVQTCHCDAFAHQELCVEDEQELVQECEQKGLLVMSLCFNFPALHEGIHWSCLFKQSE